ncbi:recombinase Cre, partial [Chimaeribacter californicus]
AIVNVGYTKTIVNNRGVVKKLAPQVTAWLSEWLEMADLATKPDAFIFCRVDRYNYAHVAHNPMGHKAIETIFADAWCALHGKPAASGISRYRTWTGHSARVGATQDMATNGVSLTQIMHEGTWKRPEQVLSYIRNTEADKSAMLSMFRGG